MTDEDKPVHIKTKALRFVPSMSIERANNKLSVEQTTSKERLIAL